jgi:hypothetical protein
MTARANRPEIGSQEGVQMALEEIQQATDYWCVTNRAGEVIHVVYGKTRDAAREHAKRSLTVCKCKEREGDFTLEQMTQEQYNAFILAEYES